MNPFLTLAVNMASCPGVHDSGLEHAADGTVKVTVVGGNPRTVAGMILRCLPPGTPTDGPDEVLVEGQLIRFRHVDPDPTLPDDYIAPLPLVDPDGRHEPAGPVLPDEVRPEWARAADAGAPSRGRSSALLVVLVVMLLASWGILALFLMGDAK